jgi:hypothetical protein
MTTPADLYPQLGQTLAFAERVLSATLIQHLAERDTKPETWYALKLIAAGGPGVDREALRADLEGSRTLDADSAGELIARLDSEGLIRGDAAISLTAEGEALFRSLRDYVVGPTIRLLSQFDVDDVETTIRTLQAITARAKEELTVTGGSFDGGTRTTA